MISARPLRRENWSADFPSRQSSLGANARSARTDGWLVARLSRLGDCESHEKKGLINTLFPSNHANGWDVCPLADESLHLPSHQKFGGKQRRPYAIRHDPWWQVRDCDQRAHSQSPANSLMRKSAPRGASPPRYNRLAVTPASCRLGFRTVSL